MTNDPSQTETLMGVTVSKRDLAQRDCSDPACDCGDDADSEYAGLPPEQVVMRLQDTAADNGDLALNDALQTVLNALDRPLLPRPDDAAAVERVARTMFERERTTAAQTWETTPQFEQDCYRDMARAALAALWESK